MSGVELAAKYSYMPNVLSYCGPPRADRLFSDYFKKGRNEGKVVEVLRRFETLYPYLRLIAEKNGKDPFDYDVVEAYWIGNEMLENMTRLDLLRLIDELIKHGLLMSIAEKLKRNLPRGLVPHHSFNVFYVGVGAITKSVPTTIANMDHCRISWCKVKEVRKKQLTVEHTPLTAELKFGDPVEKTVKRSFIPEVEVGDWISMHWNLAVQRLDQRELRNLRRYSTANLELCRKLL